MNIPAESDEQAVPPTEEPREEMAPIDGAEGELAAAADLESEADEEFADTAVTPAKPLATESVADEPAPELPESEDQAEPEDLPVTRLTLGAFGDAADDEDEEAAPRPIRIKKQRRQPLRSPRKNQPTLQQVTDRFAACGRCSYFWAGYRVLFGLEELETAVAHSKSGWLELIWDEQMPELVVKSYGVRLDTGHYHFEGCCEECRRHFIYQASDNEDEADAFRMEITPYLAK
ncbi:MAG: hypothetical protein IPM53_08215 [Anaerolineaceae bacterium]|nr:hypothetical protein [Anaerolineaceae bacterium]